MCDLIGRAIDQVIEWRRLLGAAGASVLAAVVRDAGFRRGTGATARANCAGKIRSGAVPHASDPSRHGRRPDPSGRIRAGAALPPLLSWRFDLFGGLRRRCRQAAAGSAGPTGQPLRDEGPTCGLSYAPAFRPRRRFRPSWSLSARAATLSPISFSQPETARSRPISSLQS
jgi:hypothetical protein